MSSPESLASLQRIFRDLSQAHAFGILRLWRSRAAAKTLELCIADVALYKARLEAVKGVPRFVDALVQVDREMYEAHCYVSELSHLVYAFSLFDTFLADTTFFLLLQHPRAIGPKQAVTLEVLLESQSKFDAITTAARKRTKELAYLPIDARLEYLEETFGLKLQLDALERAELSELAERRNGAVHDQGLLSLSLDDDGAVICRRKSEGEHPTPVTWEETSRALALISGVSSALVRTTAAQVLRVGPEHELLAIATRLRGMAELHSQRDQASLDRPDA